MGKRNTCRGSGEKRVRIRNHYKVRELGEGEDGEAGLGRRGRNGAKGKNEGEREREREETSEQ